MERSSSFLWASISHSLWLESWEGCCPINGNQLDQFGSMRWWLAVDGDAVWECGRQCSIVQWLRWPTSSPSPLLHTSAYFSTRSRGAISFLSFYFFSPLFESPGPSGSRSTSHVLIFHLPRQPSARPMLAWGEQWTGPWCYEWSSSTRILSPANLM